MLRRVCDRCSDIPSPSDFFVVSLDRTGNMPPNA
jgi:hypothetical protein